MRSMLLATVAAAALCALPSHACAQDKKQQPPSALGSSQSPVLAERYGLTELKPICGAHIPDAVDWSKVLD
jgi:hypothetical protein